MNTVENESDIRKSRAKKFANAVTVYPVSCERLAAGRTDEQWLEGVLAGGAKIVQLRDKHSDDRMLLEKARFFREKTFAAGALFIVNDRVDIALMSGADGVHVGQNDLPPLEIRKCAPHLIIGVSCNSRKDVIELSENVEKGLQCADYYNIGPIYTTETKEGLKKFLGPDAVREFSALCSLPFTVMGGIKDHHVGELRRAGAKRIAVVTAISQAENIAAETARWMKMISESRYE